MNFGIIIKVLGTLLLFEAIVLLGPMGISIYFGESYYPFLYTIILLLIVGGTMVIFSGKSKKMQAREALSIVTFGWILVSFFGALPFMISGVIPGFVDAFFETVSGLTTTGATILQEIEGQPKGILFWRSLTHWLGGMGILVLTLAVLPALGVGAFRIFKAESPGPMSDKLVPKVKDTAKILYTAYLGMTVLQIILLYLGEMSLYESLVHTFGTVGTGGFSTRNGSIGDYESSYTLWVITFFMIAAGVNFALYYDLWKGKWRNLFRNSELRLYLLIIVIAGALITTNLLLTTYYPGFFETLKQAFFQTAAIITTTGYGTADFDQWPEFSKAILFILMFVGGSAGSTGGGIKVARLLILGVVIRREVQRLLHPQAYLPVKLNGKAVSGNIVQGVTSFFFLYMLIIAFGTLLISLEGVGIVTAVSSVAATLGNIGPGFELVGPTQNYSQFSAPSKMLFSLFMLFGRLELFTVFLFFIPSFWKGK